MESKPEKGTTFTVVLPVLLAEDEATVLAVLSPVHRQPDLLNVRTDSDSEQTSNAADVSLVLIVKDNAELSLFVAIKLVIIYRGLTAPNGR